MKLTTITEHTINPNSTNQALNQMYHTCLPVKLKEYAEKANTRKDNPKITNPFLLAVTNQYSTSSHHLMVIGQETFTWFGERKGGEFCTENSVEDLQNLYDLFVNDMDRNYPSPIWNFYNKLNKSISSDTGIVFNNLAKIGYVGQNGYDNKASQLLIPIFQQELEICCPDRILFMSGPYYDDLIEKNMGPIHLKPIHDCLNNQRQLAEVHFTTPKYSHIQAIRTYHPAYLQRCRKQQWSRQVEEFILDWLK